jgi:hypothetical protein
MTQDEFDATYRPRIGVAFNWDRFQAERWPITRRVFTNSAEFSDSFAPWYLGSRYGEVPFYSPDAKPVRFGDIPIVLAQLSPTHRLGILTYVEVFRHQAGGSDHSVPGYALGKGRFIALDGNHRLAALVLVGVSCHVVVDEVGGPLDASCLADIAAHQNLHDKAP